MIRKFLVLAAFASMAVLQGCGGDGLNVPEAGATNGGTSQVSPQFSNATASTTTQQRAR